MARPAAAHGVSTGKMPVRRGRTRPTAPAILHQDLSADDIQRFALAMRSEPAEICRAMHYRLQPGVRVLRAAWASVQVCLTCRSVHQAESAEPVFVKAWFEF